MITLYTFCPYFDLPDASPFVMKAEVLLKMADLPYSTDTGGFGRAPKGKLPYIADDGEIVADSTFIRLHIERKYGFDFDAGLSRPERGIAWAVEKMCEDHLYWAGLHARWMVDANFDKGPRRFFQAAPVPLRPLVVAMARRQFRRNLWGHGMGRHTRAEMEQLVAPDIDAIADVLADKPYLMGDRPCGADATVFPFMAHAQCPLFETAIRTCAEQKSNLVAYCDRLMTQYFPDFADTARRAPPEMRPPAHGV
jgi:glutathione S-transferase